MRKGELSRLWLGMVSCCAWLEKGTVVWETPCIPKLRGQLISLRTFNRFLVVAVIAGVIAICFGIWYERHRTAKTSEKSLREATAAAATVTRSPTATTSSSTAADSRFDLRALARKARRSVVLIEVYDEGGNAVASGSGFFASSQGLLVTNYHVIENAARAVAKAASGEFFPVKGAVRVDRENDLALLAVEGKGLPFLSLGNSENVESGDHVVVIGNPLGLEGSLSEGIISAKRKQTSGLHEWLQITAPISPGSSGSPVLDTNGNVIGVATMVLRGGQSLNFAVPAEVAAVLIGTGGKQDSAQHSLIPLEQLSHADATAKIDLENEALKSPESLAVLNAEAEAQNAVKLYRRADWGKALECAKAFVAKYPQVGLAYSQLGNIYHKMGFADEAISAYQQALKLRPKDSLSWESLGSVLKEKGRDSQANFAFSQAIAIETKQVEIGESLPPQSGFIKEVPLERLGDINHSAGNNQAAKQAYIDAIKAAEARSDSFHASFALYPLARIYAEEGNEQEAIRMLYRWAALVARTAPPGKFDNPEAQAWWQLSEFYEDMHNEEASRRCFVKARSLGLKP